jgi:hypothetical protein
MVGLFLFLKPDFAFSQGTLSGFVVDDEFDEPLEKAVVTIPGTLISVLTDQQGKFSIKLAAGDYFLEINYPGFHNRHYNMSVFDGIATPMFIVRLKPKTFGRPRLRSVGSYENRLTVSQTLENFDTWQIAEQRGNPEFNQLAGRVPAFTIHSNGSGFGDSDVGIRGNISAATSYAFNGILLNNPETGKISSSELSGLTDWAGQVQLLSGQASNLQSQSKYGGLINVLSYAPREKAGADLSFIYGNDQFMKTSATVYSGLTKSGFASSFQLSRTAGNGTVQNSGFEQYSFQAQFFQQFNQFHTLILSLNGVVQQRDRSSADSISAYNRNGTTYNRLWTVVNNKPVSWSTSYDRNPMVSLTHFWQIRIKTLITTQIYGQFARSVQLFPGTPDKDLTWFDKPVSLNGHPIYNQAFLDTATTIISPIHAAITSIDKFGIRSVITHNFSKKLNLSGSIDLQQYRAKHFGAVKNLMNATGYTDFSNVNQTDSFNVQNLYRPGYFKSVSSGDKTDFYFESAIRTGGFSFRLDFNPSKYSWFLAGSASVQELTRKDLFNYTESDAERTATPALLFGGHAQTGIRIPVWKYHSIFLRTSYGSYQPLFTVIFPATNNWQNSQAKNTQVFDAEFGYRIFSRKLKVEATAYWTLLSNQPLVRYFRLNPGDAFGLVNNLQELHRGVELKSSYKLGRNLQLYFNGSLADWHYTKDVPATLYDSNNQQTAANDLWTKNVKVGNAPQFTLFGEIEYRWAHNFYVRLNYRHADELYAPFGLYDFIGLAKRSDYVQWKLPSYELLGFSANYLLKINKKLSANFIFGGHNLLDTEYIDQTYTNWNEENPKYTGNLVHYGMRRTWFAGITLMF